MLNHKTVEQLLFIINNITVNAGYHSTLRSIRTEGEVAGTLHNIRALLVAPKSYNKLRQQARNRWRLVKISAGKVRYRKKACEITLLVSGCRAEQRGGPTSIRFWITHARRIYLTQLTRLRSNSQLTYVSQLCISYVQYNTYQYNSSSYSSSCDNDVVNKSNHSQGENDQIKPFFRWWQQS